ncbi:uncharacterized protein MONOS_11235 [Monocercomonoides exilis]|uniref:uncharacterized protein n=1 Tax=Monocercomonoides exilis TaxID=2049356 RepID=UPI00355A085B|nr:hypothetical protein MONOS_11235 [Monocercomonoides exilis]|eukprot:MONOS_11235.1-p1 / transcript=MONOS_11235.1 / gene=MONOS_11235 / organism=Monocercomonoides_exilis_PA203 / gene_product=unspecified product / transcript_product=unspecified product / location=Mono_scaffold00553:8263-8880(-) / protein_length=135 / sequence_SO=supercontig / SO=protein_coding / is_pseudo=false
MLVMVLLARERERAREVAEERTQLVGEAVEVMWVMLEELRVRGFVREVRWKMLWLLRVRLVIAVWLRAREPAVRKKRGVFIVMEVVPVTVVVLSAPPQLVPPFESFHSHHSNLWLFSSKAVSLPDVSLRDSVPT